MAINHRRYVAVRPFLFVTGVTLAATFALIPRLFFGALRHWDEAWYAQVSREMLQTGDWLTLHWNYAPWFHKPPLFFWLQAGVFSLLGESEPAARLIPFLTGIACITIVAAVAFRWAGPLAGWAAALLLLGTPEFARYAGRGQLDVPLTLWTTTSLLLFWRGLDHPRSHWWAGLFLGLALMTKGAAAGLVLVIQCGYAVVARDLRPFRQVDWWGSLALAFLIAVPWHWHQCHLHGSEFAGAYFSRHFSQFFEHIYPEIDYRPAGPLFYFEFLLVKQPPFGYALVLLLLTSAWQFFRSSDRRGLFLWCWATLPLLALSCARTKWGWYLVPIYPGAALLATHLAATAGLRGLRWATVIGLAATLFTASEVCWKLANPEYEDHLREIAPTVNRLVPAAVPIHTLQLPRASESVYPIATLYYCQRPVLAAHGVDHLAAICRKSDAMFYVLVHRSQVQPMLSSSRQPAEGKSFHIENAGTAGPINLLRIVPGYLAREIYGDNLPSFND